MPYNFEGDNFFTAQELADALGEDEQTTPAAENQQDGVPTTKAVSERINKARADEREKLAKEFGYDSYAEMQKYKTNKAIRDEGLDPAKVSPIVDKIVEDRLKTDPRMQELDNYKAERAEEFAKKELQDLGKLLGQELTTLDQVPKDVLEDWRKSGSLKKSYLALHGEELVMKTRRAEAQGTTKQMQTPQGTTAPAPSDMRHLTDKERSVWKIMHPKMTEEDLNNKLVKKE